MGRRNPNEIMDGFKSLVAGMNSGNDPSIIGVDQVAFAVNITFRDGFPRTREPFAGVTKDDNSFPDDATKDRWNNGVFQCACPYYDGYNDSSYIVATGGRLFRATITSNYLHVTELTIQQAMTVVEAFTTPGDGVSVNVIVPNITPFAVGDVLTIDGLTYTVTARYENLPHPSTGLGVFSWLALTQVGGAGGATVAIGTVITRAGATVIWWDTNSATEGFAFIFQAENYAIILQGQHRPIIFDGGSCRRAGWDEIPAGYCGAYVNGRIWIALPNRRTFVAGDIRGGSSGTPALNYVDAILKMTENSYLNGGGAFATPARSGLITAMDATTTLDTSLGQGPVSVYTTRGVFTVNAPPDRTVWANLTYPIQTVSMQKYGAMSARGVVNINADAWYRSLDGWRSFIIARRNFNTGWGNTPMSQEMNRVLNADTASLLEYGSAVCVDNRLLGTCSPRSGDYGVIHKGLAVINFDEVSNMRNRGDPCWEGLWTGLDIHQIVDVEEGGGENGVMFCRGANNDLQIWRFDKERYFDWIVDTGGATATVKTSRITAFFESRSMVYNQDAEPKRLDYNEFFVDQVCGEVDFDVKFHPDQYPCWIDWHAWSECTKLNRCDEACGIPVNYKPGYRPYMRTPNAPETCLTSVNRRANLGEEFAFRVQWTGWARVKKMRSHAYMVLSEGQGECR